VVRFKVHTRGGYEHIIADATFISEVVVTAGSVKPPVPLHQTYQWTATPIMNCIDLKMQVALEKAMIKFVKATEKETHAAQEVNKIKLREAQAELARVKAERLAFEFRVEREQQAREAIEQQECVGRNKN